jgi:hypothetical protein
MTQLHDGLAQLLADHSTDLWKRQYSKEDIKNFVLKSPMLGNITYAKITKATKLVDASEEEITPQSNVRAVISVPALHFKDLTSGKILLRVEKLQLLPPSERAPIEQPSFDFAA